MRAVTVLWAHHLAANLAQVYAPPVLSKVYATRCLVESTNNAVGPNDDTSISVMSTLHLPPAVGWSPLPSSLEAAS